MFLFFAYCLGTRLAAVPLGSAQRFAYVERTRLPECWPVARQRLHYQVAQRCVVRFSRPVSGATINSFFSAIRLASTLLNKRASVRCSMGSCIGGMQSVP
jgi:hypothetical protein